MKYIFFLIGVFVILIGSLLLSITIDDEPIKNVILKIQGFIVSTIGVFILKKFEKFGKQKE